MNNFQPGDIITFHLRGDRFGLAQIIHVENLSQYDHYHLAIRDAVLEAGPGGLDEYGDPFERSHDLSGTEDAPVVVDHIALTYEAFLASEPMIVAEGEVDDSMFDGYQVFLHFMREDAIRRGLMRDREETSEEYSDEEYEVVGDEEDEAERVDSSDHDDGESSEEESNEEESATPETVEAHTWHMRVFDHPVGEVLFELHEIFEGEKFRETELGRFINSYFDGSRAEEIQELVDRFVDGDYGAGHELLAFGSAAADMLSQHLSDSMSPELADDILRIICDTGSKRAYEIVAEFFAVHYDQEGDPLRLPAARGFCYAVMLTGGTAEPLRPHVAKLDDLTDPELEDDLRMAYESISAAPQEEPSALPQPQSSDPFSSLGG